MRIKPKEVNRKVNLLVDPNPSFMSLVDNGANQTPWNAVKRDSVAKPKEKHVMAVNKAGKGSARKAFLQKMQFSKAQFATKADVKKYLSDNNIEGYDKIEANDDVWVVKSTEDASPYKLGKAAATPANAPGVTAFISPILKATDETDNEDENEDEDLDNEDDDDSEDEGSEDDDDDEDEDEDEAPKGKAKKGQASRVKIVDGKKTTKSVKKRPARKSGGDDPDLDDPVLDLPPELAKKFDWWGAYVSGDQTLSGVLKDGSYDGMPPGLETVMMAASYTIGNILTSDDDDGDKQASLKKVGEEMADFAFGLYGIFAKANEDTTKSVNKSVRQQAAKFVDTFSASVASATKDGTFDNVIEDDEDEDEAPIKGKSKKSTTKKGAKEEATEESGFEAILKDALGPVAKALEGVSKRISAVESRSTARKSMSDSIDDIIDEDDEHDDQEVAAKCNDFASAMGVPRSRSNP